MRIRRSAAATAVAVCLTTILVPAARAEAPGYVSLFFGRMQWTSTATGDACPPLPQTVDLGQVHDALAARGLVGNGVVITSRTPETGFRCFGGYTTHPGWDLLQAWHAEGWRFSSGGRHANATTLDYEGLLDETCDSRAIFAAHEIDASGMFAYGNNSWTTAAQQDPVSRCFGFGRRYDATNVNERGAMVAPWFALLQSVNGGRCNDAALPCYTSSGGATTRYTSPDVLAAKVAAVPDTWYQLQFYRFVTGSYTSSSWSWDCTSSDWRRHRTSQAELYCYGDFLRVVDALATAVAGGGVVATDPATVAAAWGRSLDPPAPGEPRTTATTVECGIPSGPGDTVGCTATVVDTDDDVPSAPGGQGSVVWSVEAGGGAFGAASCTPTGARPRSSCTVSFTPAGTGAVHVTATYAGDPAHSGSSGVTTVTPSNQGSEEPTVSLTWPRDGAGVRANSRVKIQASASDDEGVQHVRFYVAGTLRCTDWSAPYACGWRTAKKAGYRITIQAVARDTDGNLASDSITVVTV